MIEVQIRSASVSDDQQLKRQIFDPVEMELRNLLLHVRKDSFQLIVCQDHRHFFMSHHLMCFRTTAMPGL